MPLDGNNLEALIQLEEKPLRVTFFAAVTLIGLTSQATNGQENKRVNVPPPGFMALFNGKDLSNWQGVITMPERQKLAGDPVAMEKKIKAQNERVFSHWKIEDDGVLYYDGKGDSLQTIKDFKNFELLIDWKIEEKGDSGIYLRGQPQVQIWDSDTTPGARGADKGSGSGGLWNNPEPFGKRPLKKAD
ncbi:MAG: DUF1080 domain-containing protein, partial [Gemmataceae bacterium]